MQRLDARSKVEGEKSATIQWARIKPATDWHELSDGCYLLRSNVCDWTDEQLWKAYIQLRQTDNKNVPANPQTWVEQARCEVRVRAHILVCFLAYVLWKTLGQLCSKAGLGDEPRRVLSELSEIRLIDVVLPTDNGVEIRTTCVARPSDHQRILLEQLGLRLPTRLRTRQM